MGGQPPYQRLNVETAASAVQRRRRVFAESDMAIFTKLVGRFLRPELCSANTEGTITRLCC